MTNRFVSFLLRDSDRGNYLCFESGMTTEKWTTEKWGILTFFCRPFFCRPFPVCCQSPQRTADGEFSWRMVEGEGSYLGGPPGPPPPPPRGRASSSALSMKPSPLVSIRSKNERTNSGASSL